VNYRDPADGAAGLEWRELAPAEIVPTREALAELALQPGLADASAELEMRRRVPPSYQARAGDLLHIKDGWVETSMGTAITSDHRYILDTVRTVRQAREYGYEKTAQFAFDVPDRDVVEVGGRALLVGLPAGGNYFHWMFEAVARWLLARDHVDADTRLLIPSVGSMERAALAAAGAPEDRLMVMPASTLLRVEELVVAPRGIRMSDQIQPWAARALRALAPPAQVAQERLFISRSGAGRRRIANEPGVLEVLERHGFRAVHTEQLDVREQIDLFARAEVIVGMHGAGLTNGVFAPGDATIVELQPPGLDIFRIDLYWNQAAASGQRYLQIVCPEAPDQGNTPQTERNIEVAPAHLDAVLTRTLAARP